MFKVIVALNQLACAIVLYPIALNRETFCGLVGRYAELDYTWRGATARRVAPYLERWFHKAETCKEIYLKEQRARDILYG